MDEIDLNDSIVCCRSRPLTLTRCCCCCRPTKEISECMSQLIVRSIARDLVVAVDDIEAIFMDNKYENFLIT